MKRILWTVLTVVFVLLAVLLIPIPKAPYDDGGTREYLALTYKVVAWHRLYADGVYDETKLYVGADRHQSVDELWKREGFVDEQPAKNFRNQNYTGTWLGTENVGSLEDNTDEHLIITEIYADCFFAEPVISMPHLVKLNGVLSEEWCVGDQVYCTYENTRYDWDSQRLEADLLTVEASDWHADPDVAYKPVIYLYPEEKMDVSVNLILNGRLTCTYPFYENGWTVTALPDGTLTDRQGQTYSYLYWEGEVNTVYDLSEGFCVKGEDTAAFLEEALEKLGLTRREANEFIVYWLPQMQANPYNFISFQTDGYNDAAKLNVTPTPDTVIRVFMAWQPMDTYIECPAQLLTAPDRQGFTVVEWGGTKMHR